MKRNHFAPSFRRSRPGFTLIELLVVISIIGILAAILLPTLGRAKVKAQVTQAKVDMKNMEVGLKQYHADYGRYPGSSDAENSVLANPLNCPDFTYGTLYGTVAPGGASTILGGKGQTLLGIGNTGNGNVQRYNSDVMAILLAMPTYPNGNPTVNTNNIRNPRKTKYLDPKMSGDTRSPGVGTDLVNRDPWGNPYIITLDYNYDDKVRDGFYKKTQVSRPPSTPYSQGLNGLISPALDGSGDLFELNSGVMIWSLGPDGAATDIRDANYDGANPNGSGRISNKDNVLSWK